MKQKFLFLIAILAGIFGASLAHFWIQGRIKHLKAQEDELLNRSQRIPVVAAADAFPAGKTIEYDDIRKAEIYVNSVSFDNIEAKDYNIILGKKLTRTVEKGQAILWSYIEGGQDRSVTLSTDIGKGLRAVSIPASGIAGVAGAIRPNDRVDILASFTLPVADGAPDEFEQVVKTIMQNVTVLAIGAETYRSIQENPRAAGGGYSTVTLHVTPREAEVLYFAQLNQNRLFLTLRNKEDVYYENELPRIDFNQIENELKNLNELRQRTMGGRRAQ